MYSLRGRLYSNSRYFTRLAKCVDFCAVLFIGGLILVSRINNASYLDFLSVFIIGCITVGLLGYNGFYKSTRAQSLNGVFLHIITNVLVLQGLSVILFAIMDVSFSWPPFVFSLSIYLVLSRCLLYYVFRQLRATGLNSRNVIFIGSSKSYKAFVSKLQVEQWLGLRVVSRVDSSPVDGVSIAKLSATIDSIISSLGQDMKPDILFFSDIPEVDEDEDEDVLSHLGRFGLPVYYFPAWATSGAISLSSAGNFACVSVWPTKLPSVRLKIKRICDLTGALALIFLLSPVYLIVSVILLISQGKPLIFSQLRHGIDARPFRIYKFRTMTSIVEDNTKQRVTLLGKILRFTSIDELPQLFNVLEGTMSFVGPRPHPVELNEQYIASIPGLMNRHQFRPGLTGLAQSRGRRGETKEHADMSERVALDLEYIDSWSLGNDLRLLLMTLYVLIKFPGN